MLWIMPAFLRWIPPFFDILARREASETFIFGQDGYEGQMLGQNSRTEAVVPTVVR